MRNLKMNYYNVYYYCNIIDNLLYYFTSDINWLTTGAQFTEPYFEGTVGNFEKYSVLHQFCEFAVRTLMWEDARDSLEKIQEKYDDLENESNKAKRLRMAFEVARENSDYRLEVDRLLALSGKKHETFFKFLLDSDCNSMIDSYVEFTTFNGEVDDAIEQLTRELFYVLFQNRNFLLRFNAYMANANRQTVRRCSIPYWVKRAVKHRDRGKCVCCGADLSGILDCEDKGMVHFDHIVSLHEGGLNDVSNIQLMCKKCNLSKSSESFTTSTYKDWYDLSVD